MLYIQNVVLEKVMFLDIWIFSCKWSQYFFVYTQTDRVHKSHEKLVLLIQWS